MTRMHSSRMRTGRPLTVLGGVCLFGGCLRLGGCLPLGGVSWRGMGIPACTEAETPLLLTESQTPAKTLPWPSFEAAGKNAFFSLLAFVRYLDHVHEIVQITDLRLFCAINSTLSLVGTTCSAHLIVFMTFERFYSIIRPHKAASFNTVKRAKIAIVCISLFDLSFNSPYFFIIGNNGRYCAIDNAVATSVPAKFFHYLHFTINFVFPFVSLISMNTVIIRTLQKRTQWMTSRSQGQSQGQGIKQTDRQIYVILILMTLGFLILTTPLYIVQLVTNFGNGSSSHYYATLHLLYNIGEKTYFTNNGINFFLYVMSGKKFRSDLARFLGCTKCKQMPDVVASDSRDFGTMTSSVPNDVTT